MGMKETRIQTRVCLGLGLSLTSVPYCAGLLLPPLPISSSLTLASANLWIATWKAEKTTGEQVALQRTWAAMKCLEILLPLLWGSSQPQGPKESQVRHFCFYSTEAKKSFKSFVVCYLEDEGASGHKKKYVECCSRLLWKILVKLFCAASKLSHCLFYKGKQASSMTQETLF